MNTATILPEYHELRGADGKLYGEYDPGRRLIRFVRSGKEVLFDLALIDNEQRRVLDDVLDCHAQQRRLTE